MGLYSIVETGLVPDGVVRHGIRHLLKQRLKEESRPTAESQQERLVRLMEELRVSPVALNTRAANAQHYEVPTAFFQLVLGRFLKYSCGYWPSPPPPGDEYRYLDQSEEAMLKLTAERAGVADGQRILDLGCGWGSLSLWLAARLPAARIVGLSNSATQKAFIDQTARQRGLTNLTVITADINDFTPADHGISEPFDRILTVEMFEHVRNYERLLQRLATWLTPEGRLFVHIFCHRSLAYPFEVRDESDWMARYFFTGGLMPSAGLLRHFDGAMQVEQQWEVSGEHYRRTCAAWRQRMDRQREPVMEILRQTYGPGRAKRWWAYWRIFFMACEELFGYRSGTEWFVSHYLMAPRPPLIARQGGG